MMPSSIIQPEPANDPFTFDEVIKEVDSIIAGCMTNITHSDREQAYFEVHGVSDECEETPAVIEKALSEMKSEVGKIKNKQALQLAESMDEKYVNDTCLHLKFLRGERFDVSHAAEKFVRHFELKKDLFGESKLVKDIEQDDLNEKDIKALYDGYVQWLPLRDIRGRTVTVYFPASDGAAELSNLSKLKVFFYLRMVAMEDEAFQKRGMVSVMSTGDSNGAAKMDTFRLKIHGRDVTRATESLPGYPQCLHFCFPNMFSISSFLLFSFVHFVIKALDKLFVVRFRIHKGSSQKECMDKLQAFGIAVSVIPKSPCDNDYHATLMHCRKRLERRRRERRQQKTENAEDLEQIHDDDGFRVSFDPLDEKCKWICTGPGPKDVILGRGRKTNAHTGNIRLRTMVEELSDMYKSSPKKEKTEITQRIVNAIQTNGRFLKESAMFGWVEVPDEVARTKVSHTFRDIHKVKKRNTSDDNSKTLVGHKHGL